MTSKPKDQVKHFYFEYVGFGRWVKCDKATYDKTDDLYRLSLYTHPPQHKLGMSDEEFKNDKYA